MLSACFNKSFIRTLNNALRTDVNPRPSSHLTIHRETLFIKLVEVVPRRPMGHEVGICNQHARCVRVRFDHRNGAARLYDHCLVRFKVFHRRNHRIEIRPRARSAAYATIHDQLMGVFGDIGV